MIFDLTRFADLGFLLLRLMVAAVFATSGWSHLKDPKERSESMGMSKGFTSFLGTAEVAGALGVAFGVLTQVAALGLIFVMLGATHKKMFAWHTGFWGKHGTDGWHYDLMLLLMNLVILLTGGGQYILWPRP
jgi:putative oxidoreductase